MSRFVNTDELERIDLGDGDWVEVQKKLSYGAIANLNDAGETTSDKTTALLVAVIKKWNLKDDNNVGVPVTKDNIKRLDVGTVTVLAERVGELLAPDKKK